MLLFIEVWRVCRILILIWKVLRRLPKLPIFAVKFRETDGVLICTPEYVFSIPGALKNALEWTVGTSDFAGKPTALITASGLGESAHESLFLVLKTIEARITDKTALLISGARTKLNSTGKLSDAPTIEAINLLIKSFLQIIDE